ncbi:MAG: cytochrome c biogenesis protein [Candidatus Lokiarchaeota archaeon]
MLQKTKNNILLGISLVMLIINLFLIFGVGVFDRFVYVIFFYHVSSAWLSYLSFAVSFISHIIYLRTKNSKWINLGKNSIMIGVVFAAVTLITGSLWYNATTGNYNNIFWQWSDARQTTTLVLFLSYVSYLIFRNLIEVKNKRDELSGILGIILFPTIPLSYISVLLFNSLHPLINPNPGESGYIYWDPIKLFILLFNLTAMTIFFIYLNREMKMLDASKEELSRIIQIKVKEAP